MATVHRFRAAQSSTWSRPIWPMMNAGLRVGEVEADDSGVRPQACCRSARSRSALDVEQMPDRRINRGRLAGVVHQQARPVAKLKPLRLGPPPMFGKLLLLDVN